MSESAPTFRALVTSFTDFLTVAIHTVLYERDIYPRTSFLSARKYSLPVRQSRHPKVCEWINDAVAAVEAELLKGGVERIAVVIYDRLNRPLERFMLDVSRFPSVNASDIDMPLGRTDEQTEDILPRVDMEEQFRATLSKLAGCSSVLKRLPEGCTFTVAIELKPEGDAPIAHPQLWIPVQATVTEVTDAPRTMTKPVRAVAAGDMNFETWIEESEIFRDDG